MFKQDEIHWHLDHLDIWITAISINCLYHHWHAQYNTKLHRSHQSIRSKRSQISLSFNIHKPSAINLSHPSSATSSPYTCSHHMICSISLYLILKKSILFLCGYIIRNWVSYWILNWQRKILYLIGCIISLQSLSAIPVSILLNCLL